MNQHEMGAQPSKRHRSRKAATLTGLAALLLLGAPVGEAVADDLVFAATSSASGVRLQMFVPAAPATDTVLDAGGPTTKAVLEGLGDSRAYGSFPFPGELAATAPGLVRGLGNVPAPDYPFYASSYHPTSPKQEFGGGGVHLLAESTQDLSKASAEATAMKTGDGTEGVGIARSKSSTTRTSEGVVATALSETAAVRIGQLTLGHVRSVAKVTLDNSGARQRSSELRITGADVGGQAVTIGAGGIAAAGSPVPGLAPKPLQEALAGTGIAFEIAPSSRTATGISAPALRVTRTLDTGEKVIVLLGAASAAIDSPGATDSDSEAAPAGAVAEPASPAAPADQPPSGPAPTPAAGPEPSVSESQPFVPAAQPVQPSASRAKGSGPFSQAFDLAFAPSPGDAAAPSSGPETFAAPPSVRQIPAPAAAVSSEVPRHAGRVLLASEIVNRTSSGPALFAVVLAAGLAAVTGVGALLRKPNQARN